jgi:L-2-hydroxyglutarate oxidase LhgO
VIYDYCVIGGMLLKREGHVTAHRTGHNSGVIHPGIY